MDLPYPSASWQNGAFVKGGKVNLASVLFMGKLIGPFSACVCD